MFYCLDRYHTMLWGPGDTTQFLTVLSLTLRVFSLTLSTDSVHVP